MLIAVTGQYPDQLVDAFLELGVAKRRVDRNLLREDLSHLLSRYYGRPLGEIQLGELIEEALVVVRRHRLQLPANLTLLLKALVMCEGLGTRLDPTFNLTAVLVPYAERLMTRRYSPDVLGRRLGRFFAFGFLVAGGLGLFLAWSILRSGRR